MILVVVLPLIGAPAAGAADTAATRLSSQPAATAPAASGGLSDSGQAAIADLRTCLASREEHVLNVYYLIDSSRSLAVADGGGKGSDPTNLRAPILANSLEQLGALDPAAKVNWAAGFFSTDFTATIGWSEWKAGSKDQLDSAIVHTTPSGYTNWPEALTGAQTELADQQSSDPGCQMLVWLTDGQIDIGPPDGQGPEDLAAINTMCGQPLIPSAAAPDGYGVFNSFRQSGVVVIGALLATTATSEAAGQVMQPLIEGTGTVDDRQVSCGQQPMPSGYVHGAFVEATTPDALAQVFLQLGAQVGGGYPSGFDADGSFAIDPGVARFRIVLSGPWTLTAPDSAGLDPASDSATQDWAVVSTQNGATVIDVTTGASERDGTWRLQAGDTKSLFLFSDLSIAFPEKNQVAIGADGALDATLTAQVVDAKGQPAPIDTYGTADFTATIITPDGAQQIPGATVNKQTGEITIPLPSDVSTAQITVSASIDPLVTAEHHLVLAPVTTQQSVQTVLPANFPRVHTIPAQLSTLEGAHGTATGGITVDGPQSGGDGKVCVTGKPEVTSDSANRAAGWEWQWTTKLDAEGCIAVKQGSTDQRITLSASNATPADSLVRASAAVTFVSGDGAKVTQDVPIEFRSTHPVNVGSVALVALGLLLLGILLPLILLWILNWWTTRLEVGTAIQRATFPVQVTPGGIRFLDVPTSDTALSERFRYRGEARNVRALADPELGRIRARLPWFPLNAPEYEVAPPSGVSIVSARTGARTASAAVRSSDGAMRLRQLPFDAFWAITVTDAEIARTAKGEAVNGTAVIYHRFDAYEPAQYRDRIADIERETTASDAIDRLRTARAAAASRSDGGGSGAPESVPAMVGAPPRSAGSAAPPTLGGPPPRPSAAPGGPPPRPSATPGGPPPLPGSPPPRPAAPPPRGR